MKVYRVETFKGEERIPADDVVADGKVLTFVQLEGVTGLHATTVAVLNEDEWSRVYRDDVQQYADAVEKLKHLSATREHAVGVAVTRLLTLQASNGADGRVLQTSEMFDAINETLKPWLDVPDQPMKVRASLPDAELRDRAWQAIQKMPIEVVQAAGLYSGVTLEGAAVLMAEYLTACATPPKQEAGKARYGDRIAVFRKLDAAGLFHDRRPGEETVDGLTVQDVENSTGSAMVILKVNELKARMLLYRDGMVDITVVQDDKVIAASERPTSSDTGPKDEPLPFVPEPGAVLTAEDGASEGERLGSLTVLGPGEASTFVQEQIEAARSVTTDEDHDESQPEPPIDARD